MILYKKGIAPILDAKKNYQWKKRRCNDTIISFDIETTSTWIDEKGNMINDKNDLLDTDYTENYMPCSLCYLWQCSIDDVVYYGRELKSAKKFLIELSEKNRDINMICFCHNLAFEFQFLCGYFELKKVFARSSRHPIYAIFHDIENITFRCSYILTRLSLDNWGKKLGFEKLHTLDYNVIRTPKTKLTKKELEYAERDVLVVRKGIQVFLKEYKHLENIPLTQTGQVRREVQKILTDDFSYNKYVAKLLPNNFNEYLIATKLFQGGYCHANFLLANRVINDVESFDFSSSYPYVMVACLYPMTPFTIDVYDEKYIWKFAYILKIRFYNIDAKTCNHYISSSKCLYVKNGCYDNGRLISADEIEIYLTELDFEIVKKTYDFAYEIVECYSSCKAYLPKKLIHYILKLYSDKTKLKNVKGQEEFYMKLKERINSIFGMTVTSILNDDIEMNQNTGEWTRTPKTKEEVDDYLQKCKSNPKRKNFLSYYWGIWVTSWARFNLWTCLLGYDFEKKMQHKNNDFDVIYCDTDSIKKRGKSNFSWYNKIVDEKLKKSARMNLFSIELCRPKDINGIEHPLGYFEKEDDCSEFITLGAKRYCYRKKKDNSLHITVSGVPKSMVTALNNDINNFTNNFIFPRSHENAPKLLTYLQGEKYLYGLVWNKGKYDEYVSRETWGICMRRKSYSMSLTDEYEFLLSLAEEQKGLYCVKNETEIL